MEARQYFKQIGRFLGLPKRGAILLLAVAAMVGGIVCWEVASLLTESEVALEEARILVVRRSLSEGYPIHFLDLLAKPVGKLGEAIPPGALTDQDLHLLKGAFTKRALLPHTVLTLDALHLSPSIIGLAETVPRGLRAYPIRASYGMSLRSRDRVDILFASNDSSERAVALLEGVLVLQRLGKGRTGKVVVAVSKEQVPLLEEAQTKGRLTLVLRNPNDVPSNKRQRRNIRLGKKKPRRAVEIWEEK